MIVSMLGIKGGKIKKVIGKNEKGEKISKKVKSLLTWGGKVFLMVNRYSNWARARGDIKREVIEIRFRSEGTWVLEVGLTDERRLMKQQVLRRKI